MSYTEIVKGKNGITIRLTDAGKEERAAMASGKRWYVGPEMLDLSTWLEGPLGNGWEMLRPEEIGALTAAPILSDDVTRDEDGTVVRAGDVYWYPQYETTDPVAVLLAKGEVFFTKGAD